MAAQPPRPSKVGAPTSPAATVRIGHVYLDVRHRLLHCLNDVAQQLQAEGVPFLAADLARRPLRRADGQSAQGGDLPLVRSWRRGEVAEGTFFLPREGQAALQLTWSASPVRDSAGKVIAVLGTVLAGSPEPDWQALAGMAHDLRTPLQALGLLVELAECQPPTPEELPGLLERVRAAAERAMGIGLDLLEWCRSPVQKGKRPERAWFAVEPFLAGLAEEQRLAAEHKSLSLVANVAAARGWEVNCDRVGLGRLLSNLLVNAVRYTTTGQVEFTASWRDDRSGKNGSAGPGRKLSLSIVDTGAGMSLEEQESIFQPFERGRAGKEGDSGGSGLGLAVVDRLVEELGLELEVYSEYGRGSAFHLLLPAGLLRPVSG